MSKPSAFNGFLDGNGSSNYGARADHNHAGDGVTLKAVKKTIKTTDWNNSAAEVPFTEGTYVSHAVAFTSQSAAAAAVLVLSSIGTGKLTFGCTNTPASAIDVYILYL